MLPGIPAHRACHHSQPLREAAWTSSTTKTLEKGQWVMIARRLDTPETKCWWRRRSRGSDRR